MSKKSYLTMNHCRVAANQVADIIRCRHPDLPDKPRVFGIPRGGLVPALLLADALGGRVVESLYQADIIMDDLVDSGRTMKKAYDTAFKVQQQTVVTAALYRKYMTAISADTITSDTVLGKDTWLVFPWERPAEGEDVSQHDIVVRMLQSIGEDVERPGLLETPSRVVKSWDTFFGGYKAKPEDIIKLFEDGAKDVDEMVLLTDIPVMSHCEHHMVPFIGVAHVAYIPNGKIIGLSKIPKLVDVFARRLQVQERLTNQIADAMMEHMAPHGVGVVIKAQHFCMTTRGVKTPGVWTTTSAVRGYFKDKPETRAEFLGLLPRS